jgi:NADH-quinone oxidoreductase subunit E
MGSAHVDLSKRHSEKPSFSAEKLSEVKALMDSYPEGKHKSALIRILHLVQSEKGWVSVPSMDKVAEILNIQPIEVYEVATFYTMFHLEPVGKYVFEVCRTGPCMLVGSDDLIDHIGKKLNIQVGETSSDGMFTLKTAECLGGCGYGPLLQCKYKFHEHLTKERVDELIEEYRSGKYDQN